MIGTGMLEGKEEGKVRGGRKWKGKGGVGGGVGCVRE